MQHGASYLDLAFLPQFMQLSQWAWGKQAKLMRMLKIKHELKFSTKSGPCSGMINVKTTEKQHKSMWIEDMRKHFFDIRQSICIHYSGLWIVRINAFLMHATGQKKQKHGNMPLR